MGSCGASSVRIAVDDVVRMWGGLVVGLWGWVVVGCAGAGGRGGEDVGWGLVGTGSVLIPVDAAGRLLELLLLLEEAWTSKSLPYPLVLLSPVAHTTLRFTRSQLEWMNESIVKLFGNKRGNPFALKCAPARPSSPSSCRYPLVWVWSAGGGGEREKQAREAWSSVRGMGERGGGGRISPRLPVSHGAMTHFSSQGRTLPCDAKPRVASWPVLPCGWRMMRVCSGGGQS